MVAGMSSGMPASEAQRRGVRSFFADSRQTAGGARRCVGLACYLAAGGAPPLPGQAVHCLGYCDRGPAGLRPDGTPVLPGGAGGQQLPDIRSLGGTPVVTARLLEGGAPTLEAALRAGVYGSLRRALADRDPASVLAAVEASGEQGRGGAGFPTGRKWRAVAESTAPHRYVVANGDEGDPGSFIDRVLLEWDPHAVIEGLALCAYAVGARQGVVYIRSEYPAARLRLEAALAEARAAGLLGPAPGGSGFALDLRVVAGQGSYVCGEESALLNAIEGQRGEVRVRPPYPAARGLHGHPTVVNNIETLVNIPWIVGSGPAAYRRLGTTSSPGTKAFCLSNGFARPGIVEAPFGVSLKELVWEAAGGGREGQPLAAVALGGPMGSVLTPAEWDLPLDYPALAARGVRLGHGGLVAIPAGTDFHALALHWLDFMVAESCGKCVPCRLGSVRALELARGPGPDPERARELGELLALVATTSLCGFGQGLPAPVLRLLELAGWELPSP